MKSGHACESVSHSARDMNLNHHLPLASCALKPELGSQYHGPGCLEVSERLCNGLSDQSGLENFMSHCNEGEADGTVISEDDSRSLPSSTVEDEDDLTPEIRQAYRIFQSFLSEKHKATTAPFWQPVGPGSQGDQAPDGEMCFKKMDDKFVNREYESITAFVADFRLMLENCYRFHGVHHWMSKQAQKLEMILEQKLTLLSRTLREKTTLAVTSKGRFGTEDEKGPAGASSRRRSVPRSLAAITVGGSESIMVQALRLEELQRAKEEKRQRELEKKEAEEVSVKEMEEWERSLLSLADPWSIRTMWELPAIGHFLCLAQTALNLPEIVFYELERCLLMPRCSSFLSKVMTSLLCPPHKRPTLHRRPPLPYRKWEAELRRRVQGWYQAVGRSEDQVGRAEQLGLCHQFFWTVGEMNPLEETPFHLLPFNRRVWLLKGLCDHVYETQKDVQDAVLGQPIHECRESILGYDGQENTYIHFPHFCGADLRIYRQSPCLEMEFPLPLFHVKRSEEALSSEKTAVKDEMNKGSFLYVDAVKVENDSSGDVEMCAWGLQGDSLHDGEELNQKCPSGVHLQCKEDSGGIQEKSMELKHLKEEQESNIEPCFRVGDSCYKGKSPALSLRTDDVSQQTVDEKRLCAECSGASPHLCTHCHTIIQPKINSRRDQSKGKMGTTKRKKRKKKSESTRKTNTGKLNIKARRLKKRLHRADNIRKKKQKLRRKLNVKIVSVKRKTGPVEPSLQLVCSSLDDLRGLISRTEDELDQINSTKKRSVRLQHKRSTVKELHITLVRLLNELLPWEPKLVKAFQKNRARMKKEFDDFKKHPEYENFTREQMDSGEDLSLSTETTREPEDEVKAVRTLTADSDVTEHLNQFESHKSRCPDFRPEVIMTGNETGPFTRASKRRHINAVNEEQSTFKKGKMDPESSSSFTPNIGALISDPTSAKPQEPSERASGLSEPVRSFQGTSKHIQALLAKSVGNKVTLINHPNTAVIAQRMGKTLSSTHQPVQTLSTHPSLTQLEPVCTVTQTSKPENTEAVVYKTAGGLGLLTKGGTSVKFSVQPISNHKPGEKVTQQVFILPSNLLIQSTEIKAAQQSPDLTSVSVPNTTNTVPENKVPVQQVAPLKETSEVRTPCAAVLPSLRTLPKTTGGSTVPKKTEPKVVPNKSTTKPDAKQELRTVCIRDSQSILVTTRGGNTGVVKVQTSEQSGTLKPSPVFAISPQLKAFLVSKSFTSTTQSGPGTITPVMNRESLSKDIIPVSSTGILTSSVLNQTLSSDSTSAQTLLTAKPLLLSTSKISDSVRLTVKDVHKVQQNTSVMQSGSRPSDHQSTFQKVFLVGPSTNLTSAATKITTTTATCTVPGSRFMFINHSHDNSTRVIPKDVPFTSPALDALKIIPNLHGCTTSGPVTNIQSISLSGLTSSRILGTSTKTTPVIVSRVHATSMSSGLQNKDVARSSESVNSESLLKAAGSVEGKTFSTLGTGHMASSELLSVVKRDTSVSTPVSVLSSLNSKTGLVVGSSVSDISSSFSGSFLSKHTTLPLHCVTAGKPQAISSLCTSPSSINTCTAGLSHHLSISSTVQTQTSNISTLTSPGVVTSGMRPPNSEKIVINTSAPLAPGTQLLINNTRFVVPPQGLGPGSHVLLISNSSHGVAPSPPRGLNASGPFPSVVQGMKTQQTLLRLPSPTTSKAGVHQQVNMIASRSSAPVPQPLHAGVSSEQPGLANIVRFPVFHTSDGKGLVVTPSHRPSETSVVCSLPQGPLLNTTSARPPPHNQVVPAVRTVISQNAPVNSTISRMQKLPVATVPPVGCLNISSEVTPVATVPPSLSTVIMTQRQPIRAVQPGAYGNPVILHQQPQTQSKSVVQITSSTLTNSTASKLLLSPDGAILNIVQASTPSNVEVPGKPMRAHVDVPTVSRVTVPVLHTKTDHPEGLNH